MNARTIAPEKSATTSARFDAKFIEEHGLIERYLDDKLPMRGARDLENWCRLNPAYLDAIKLSDRAQASLKLLEASGQPLDLGEPKTPWWKTPYVPIGLLVISLTSLLALWVLVGKFSVLREELADTRTRMQQGPLVQPAIETSVRVTPDRAAGVDHARIVVNTGAPQLMDVHIDMSYTKALQFRVLVDKKNQGRALILDNVLKDSNGDLRLTVNTTGLSPGTYAARIEALPLRGTAGAVPTGWLLLEVR